MHRLLESERVQELLERAGLGALPPRTVKAVVVAAAVVIGVGLWRFWPSAPAPEIPFEAQTPPPAASVESTAPAGEIVVHVAGAVFTPGVYHLPADSRVADAVAAAGGGLATAALDSLNLARILSDGEQVYVLTTEQAASGAPSPGTGGGAGPVDTGAGAEGRVNINTASATELEELPGVGPATAQKIVDEREANGPFAAPEDLMRVPGIGEKKFESLREYVVCG